MRLNSADTLKNIGLVIGAIGTLFGIYKYAYPDSPTFAAQVEVEQVSIPSDLFADVERYEEDVNDLKFKDGAPQEMDRLIDGCLR